MRMVVRILGWFVTVPGGPVWGNLRGPLCPRSFPSHPPPPSLTSPGSGFQRRESNLNMVAVRRILLQLGESAAGRPGLVCSRYWGAWRCEHRGPLVPYVLHATPKTVSDQPRLRLSAEGEKSGMR